MKFCINCGHELKKGTKFCVNCGAKIEELKEEVEEVVEEKVDKKPKKTTEKKVKEEKKVEEEVKEEVEEVVEEEPVVEVKESSNAPMEPYYPPKKKSVGKIVFLSILITALVAAIVVLIILLVNKNSGSGDSKEPSSYGRKEVDVDEPKDDDDDDDEYVGTWKRRLIVEQDGDVVEDYYAEFVFKKNGKFEYEDDESDEKFTINGTYEVDGNEIEISYKIDGEKFSHTLYIDNGKLCIGDKKCPDYFVKNSKNYTVRVDFDDYYEYNYDDDDDIVDVANEKVKVYIFEAGGCPYCEAQVEYLEKLSGYGKKFEIVRKELYVDHINWEIGKDYNLGKKTAELFQEHGFEDANINGTPFVVISNVYAVTSYSTDLEDIIDQAYKKGHVDVVGCLDKGGTNCFQ